MEASEEIFQTLIEIRLGKVRELCKWLNREVTILGDQGSVPPVRQLGPLFANATITFSHRWDREEVAKIISVNRFWVTFQDAKGNRKSESLEKLSLTYDDKNDRLKIIVIY